MAVVRYTAKRSLQPPTTVDTVVTYDLPIAYAGLTRARVVNVVHHRSLTGAQAAYYYAGQQAWDIQTKPVVWDPTGALLVQFLDSVESGEAFEFSPGQFASEGGSISWTNVVLDSDGYVEPLHPSRESLASYTFRFITVP
jgi:hypothetical protein